MRKSDIVWSRWEEVDRLFARVIELPAAEQDALLDDVAHGDPDLAAAVRDLLQLSDTHDPRSASPGPHFLREALSGDERDDTLEPDEQVGRYRILSELGRGGMATVYAAERADGVYRQSVALKVLRRGFDTDRIVARFLAERQILSDFAHPNIARLLDGGATRDGRPFLVMERVDGPPITQWADERRLSIERRLELLLQVTAAVQEAHRRLVVHRDIKPSNILVDEAGRVKLLDFGIAKLVDPNADEPDLTLMAPYPLTWRYASPEQTRGEPVTTSSDVYQLGLILYELVAGNRPFNDDGFRSSAERGEPPPPSAALDRLDTERAHEIALQRGLTQRALRRRLRGDIDRIAARALQPDPELRYRSVEDLALDIRLHLAGWPIAARPAPRSLRMRKWLKRNRWATPVSAVLLLAFTGYIATLTLTAQRLEQERNEARLQAERAEQIRSFLIDLFRSADPFASDAAGTADLTIGEAVSNAAQRIRTELRGQPAMQADLLSAVASLLANIDRAEQSRRLVGEALALRDQFDQTGTPAYAADLQVLAMTLGVSAPDSAEWLREQSVSILRETVAQDDPRLAAALSGLLGFRARRLNENDPTIGEEALAIYEAAGPAYALPGAEVLVNLAQAYSSAGRLEDAERAAREGLRRRQQALGPDHAQTAIAGAVLASVFDAKLQFAEAVPLYLENLRVFERAVGADHNQTLSTKNNLATTYFQMGRLDEAAAMHREILTSWRRIAGTDLDQNVATSLQNLAAALKNQGKLREADSLAARAHEIYLATTPRGHYLPAFPLLTRSEILLLAGDSARAAAVAADALAILQPALPEDHFAIGVAHCRRGAALLGSGSAGEALAAVSQGVAILRRDGRTPTDYLNECEATMKKVAAR